MACSETGVYQQRDRVDYSIGHVTYFMKLILDLAIFHEYIMMIFFMLSLDSIVMEWFDDLGKGEKYSFAGFI